MRLEPAKMKVTALALAAVLVVLVLFNLAIASAGWDLETLTWAQTILFVTLGVLVWTRMTRYVAITRPLLGMMAAIAITTVWSVRPDSGVRALLMWTMYLSIFTVTASALTGPTAARRFLDGTVSIGGWLCLLALTWFWGAKTFGTRWYATFYWPNPFAAFLLLLLPITLTRYLYARGIRESLAHGIISLVFAVALILTYSRGAWVSLLLIAPLTVIVLRPPSPIGALQRLAMLAAVVALSVVLLTGKSPMRPSEGVLGRAASITGTGDQSIQARLSFWRSGLAIFHDHPIVGTGPWTYGIVHTRYQDDVRFYASDAHNLYIQTAAEMGVVGMTALAMLLTGIASLWIRTLRQMRPTPEYPLVAGLGLGLTAFFMHSGMDADWLFPANPAMAFAFVGVLAWFDQSVQPPLESSVGSRSGKWRLAVGLALLLAIIAVQSVRAAHHQFVEGQQLLRTGQWSAAADRFTRATRWNPLQPEYRLAQAMAATQGPTPRLDDAIASAQRAIALDRMNASGPVQLAMLLMTRGGTKMAGGADAEVLLHRALVLDRFNDPGVYRLLARLYRRQGRTEEAEHVYRNARSLYIGHGLGSGAIIYGIQWQKAIDLFLDDADLAAQRGDFAQAAQVLTAVLTEDPTAVRVAVRLSTIYSKMGRSDKARAVLEGTAVRVPESMEIEGALKALR
jgi:putative inorganic carbon (HCO3(-)) transporter